MAEQGNPFTDLTWDDLRQWAGAKILSRGKNYVNNVSELSRTEEGEWIAWVSGSAEYATSVKIGGAGEIGWFCTCPFGWGPCKHAVAVILAGIEQCKAGKDIPIIDSDGDLFCALLEDPDEYDEIFGDDCDWADEEFEPVSASRRTAEKETALNKMLSRKSKKELTALLVDLANHHPEVKKRIFDEERLASGRVDEIVRSLRKEIRDVTDEDAWYNPWKGVGNLPDYSHIREQLSALLHNGHADAVVELGRELWERGQDQVGQSHDEGECAIEAGTCMDIVFEAVGSSSLPAPAQLVRMIDVFLEDQYCISNSLEKFIEQKKYTPAHGMEVGEELQKRLAAMPKPGKDDFSARYERERLMRFLVQAYERSGREEKVIPLLEKEVRATECYEWLVRTLIGKNEIGRARAWCIKGFEQTAQKARGIAHGLRQTLRELAAKEKKDDLVAAYRAEEFFDRPCRAAYAELQKAAEEIKVWPQVRIAALHFLETGIRPDSRSKGPKKQVWPLPPPEVRKDTGRGGPHRFPDSDMLIDIAILEKRLDDVVRLYREKRKTNRRGSAMDHEVADAVADSHPDTSLAIWKQLAAGKISLVKPKAYEEAAAYLRKMRTVYKKTKRTGEWQAFILSLRTEHKAKRRLMEVLDSLEGKRLID